MNSKWKIKPTCINRHPLSVSSSPAWFVWCPPKFTTWACSPIGCLQASSNICKCYFKVSSSMTCCCIRLQLNSVATEALLIIQKHTDPSRHLNIQKLQKRNKKSRRLGDWEGKFLACAWLIINTVCHVIKYLSLSLGRVAGAGAHPRRGIVDKLQALWRANIWQQPLTFTPIGSVESHHH